MKTLKINPDRSDETCIFFVWPLEIVHVIDQGDSLNCPTNPHISLVRVPVLRGGRGGPAQAEVRVTSRDGGNQRDEQRQVPGQNILSAPG